MCALEERLQAVDVKHQFVTHSLLLRVRVETCHNVEPVFGKATIMQQHMAQRADTHQHRFVATVVAKKDLHVLKQSLDMETPLGTAWLGTDASQILASLHRVDAQTLGNGSGGDKLLPTCHAIFNLAIVRWKPSKRRFQYNQRVMSVFHVL